MKENAWTRRSMLSDGPGCVNHSPRRELYVRDLSQKDARLNLGLGRRQQNNVDHVIFQP